eukprot:NODE_437_length_1670_cov_226.817397_g341_i0.p1 GENE.NODE_437_length_1670_cov_226.817397_g341_i0~~NODE_437_length_1670_cov_226.817397_g341_i0.p1  ORF type:complete len:421 (+),score=84.98 NODE_437_length_1670_cov_226.817397_g341_i0:253-1515(+)
MRLEIGRVFWAQCTPWDRSLAHLRGAAWRIVKGAVLYFSVPSAPPLFCYLLSPSRRLFFWAVVVRTIHGILNPTTAIAKAYVGIVAEDDHHRREGFSTYAFAIGLGYIIGPLLGGMLADPVHQYGWGGSFLAKYRYFAPCTAVALVNLISLILVAKFCSSRKGTPAESKKTATEMTPLIATNSQSKFDEEDLTPKPARLTFWQLIVQREVFCTSFMYGLICLGRTVSLEALPLWGAASNHIGGLEFSSNQIGTVTSVSGVTFAVFQLFLFSPLCRKFGPSLTFKMLCLLYVPAALIQGLAGLTAANSPVLTWIILLTMESTKNVCTSGTSAAIFIIANDIVAQEYSGTVNGIAQSFASVARAIGPALAGILFSKTANDGMSFPFNYYVTFVVLALCFGISWLMSFWMLQGKEVKGPKSPA